MSKIIQKTKGKYVVDIIDGIIYSTDNWAIYNLYQKMFFKDGKEEKVPPESKSVVNSRLWTYQGEIIKGNNVKQWTLNAMVEEYKRLMWKYQFHEDKMEQLTEELRRIEKRLKDE